MESSVQTSRGLGGVTEAPPLPDASSQPANRRQITGIVPPLPTPFRDGRVDISSLDRLLDYLLPHVDGVLIGGSTGEAASLSIEEREAVIRATSNRLAGTGRSLVVSIADNSLVNSRRLSSVACDMGADLLALSCPNYFPNSQTMLENYFGIVANFAAADLCLYDNPIASNTVLSIDAIFGLVENVESLTHIKMTDVSIGKIAAILSQVSVTILAGEDSVLWHQLSSGAVGTMSAIAMIYPERTAALWQAFRSGDQGAAYQAYREVAPFITCGIHGDDYVAVVKEALHSQGILASPEVRPPLLPLDASRKKEIFDLL